MRIRVKSENTSINLVLPTNWIFNKGTVWLARRFGVKYAAESMKNVPPEALDRLFRELRRIKRTRGRWELVEVRSADGDEVQITL